MTPLLSFILLLLTLLGFVTGLINAVRKYKNPSVKLGWILVPLFFSFIALFINIYTDQSEWNMKNLVKELSSSEQDSSEIENNFLSDTLKQLEHRRKIVRKPSVDKQEFQSLRDTSAIAEQGSDQANLESGSRTITPEQRRRFVNILRDESKGTFRIQYIAGDKEAFEYSRRISDMLTEAGYSISGDIGKFAGNEAVQGISIVINRNETQPRYAEPVFDAFRSIGINIAAERNKQLVKPLEILISVGHKK